MDGFIRSALEEHYHLNTRTLREVPGGWSAAAFVAHTDRGGRFVKVYDKNRPSVRGWIDRMALYMPAVLWLSAHTALGGSMVAPVLTHRGGYRVESDGFVLLVFPLVAGDTLGERPLSHRQIIQLADVLALLHSFEPDGIPVPTEALNETYFPDFLDDLHGLLTTETHPPSLENLLRRQAPTLRGAMDNLGQLAGRLRTHPPRHALCHTDLHGWNLMWDGGLVLIDWEGLRLAPVEADLFVFSEGFFFDRAKVDFLSAYRAARSDYVPDQTAMAYYRLRRRLEDIAEFAGSIASDDLPAHEAAKSLSLLQRECAALDAM